MTIQEIVDRGIKDLTAVPKPVHWSRYSQLSEEAALRQYTQEVLQAVVDGLPQTTGQGGMNIGYSLEVYEIKSTLTRAISDLSGKEVT